MLELNHPTTIGLSRLRCVVHRCRQCGRPPANQRETGFSKRDAIPFHSPTTDRTADVLCEPSAKREFLRTWQPWDFRRNDIRLKDWAELLGVVR